MDNKGKRETGELASVWYGEPYEDRDEDAVDIRPRRQRRSVTESGHGGSAVSGGARTPGGNRTPNGARTSDGVRTPGGNRAPGAQRPAPSVRPAAQSVQARRPLSQNDQTARAAQSAQISPAPQRTAAQPPRAQTSPVSQASPDTDAAERAAVLQGADMSGNGQSGDTLSETNGVLRRTSIPPERMQTMRTIPTSDSRRTTENAQGGDWRDMRQSPRRNAADARKSDGSRPSGGSRRRTSRRKPKLTVGCVVRRVLLVLLTVIVFAVGALFAVANTLANGPSETARSKAVMSAMQASAVKWLPGLFLPDDVIDKIIADSKVVVTDVRPITDVSDGDGTQTVITEDRWAKAVDGMIYENVNGKTFKGYVLLIKDPSRVSVAISDESFAVAKRIFEIADQYGAIAAINGGEFPDNGVVTGANPMGLTYSGGRCVWDDGLRRTFIGFTKDNKLYVEEGTTREQADAAGVRDAVAFQTGNTLITNDGENVTYYYADSNTGVAQRTGIGQLADGTVMFLVTDGRTASSMGATKNDIIDTFAKYGAITAGLLDGGSSSMLYYRDWYDKYNVDKSQLDEWQQMGLVNRYKAFTNPRTIPTFFIVK